MSETYFQEVGPKFSWMKNISRNMVPIFHGWNIFSGIWSQFFDMSPASGYMGEKCFQEFGPNFLTCLQLVGTWMKNIFRNLVPISYGWKISSGIWSHFLWVTHIFGNLVPIFYGWKIFSGIWSQFFMGVNMFMILVPIFWHAFS